MTRKVLNACRLQKYGVSIILSNDKQVQYLNYKWKGRNKPTNVLSFSNNETIPDSNFQKHSL